LTWFEVEPNIQVEGLGLGLKVEGLGFTWFEVEPNIHVEGLGLGFRVEGLGFTWFEVEPNIQVAVKAKKTKTSKKRMAKCAKSFRP